MENYNNEIFGFGNNTNEEMEQNTNFNYDSISGLGQSDYENEDLFSTEVENNNGIVFNTYDQEPTNSLESVNDFRITRMEDSDLDPFENIVNPINQNMSEQNFESQVNIPFEQDNSFTQLEPNQFNNENTVEVKTSDFGEFVQEQPSVEIFEQPAISVLNNENETKIEEQKMNFDPMTGQPINQMSTDFNAYIPQVEEQNIQQIDPIIPVVEEQPIVENVQQPVTPVNVEFNEFPTSTVELQPEEQFMPVVEEQPVMENVEQPVQEVEESQQVESQPVEEEQIDQTEGISISDTPIEELNKLTEYYEDKIEETDINALFDKVSVNVKDASDIFRKNTDLKQKIDTRFEELKKLQSGLENSRKKQIDEINKYKEEVLDKLTEKKEEIERRLNVLKETQVNLEKEKKEFEEYKKKEQENIDKVQKEVQSAYDDRREELNHIEDVLRKQKDALDEERSQLSLDRIQYESDKNELANNLLKFNEIVNSFTNGVDDIKE